MPLRGYACLLEQATAYVNIKAISFRKLHEPQSPTFYALYEPSMFLEFQLMLVTFGD